jgi:dihydrofolate reductase
MGKVFLDMAISLDGFISGMNNADGGLHDWYFSETGKSQQILEELQTDIGAMILGARAFGDSPDGFDTPYKIPHFILTHKPRATVNRDGAQFIFVTDGIQSALEQAKVAAGSKDICIAGGADTARQYIRAGLLDEIQLHLVPVLLGSGLRLFENLAEGIKLEISRVIEAPLATHIRYRVVKRGENHE